MVSATPTSPSVTLPQSGRDPEGVRHEPDDGAMETSYGDLTLLAFEAVLALARTSSDIHHGGLGGRLSPAQMFEPDVADAHDKTQAALKADDKPGNPDHVQDASLDRSSVRARRAWYARQANDISPGPASARTATLTGGGDLQKGTSSVHDMAQRDLFRLLSPETTVNRAERVPPPSDDSQPASRWAIAAPAKQEGSWLTPRDLSSTTHAVANVDRVDALSRSPTPNPAQQIAQLLGSGRAGEVESARAVSSAPDSSSSNASGDEQRGPRLTSVERQDRAAPNERSVPRGDGKADSTQRSPFDELVRSIRLHSSAGRSSARMHLHPPELGRVHVNLRVAGDKIEIDVRTETTSARDLVCERAAQLSQALQQHGIHVDRFDVTTDLTGGQQDLAHGSHDSQAADPWGGDGELTGGEVPLDGIDETTGSDVGQGQDVVGETRLDIRV